MRSLKSRALQLLAQREQSRVELRRKLMAFVKAEDAVRPEGEADAIATSSARLGATGPMEPAAPLDALHCGVPEAAAARVDAVLDWLAANRFVSDERFAESRAQARASRFGNLRIRQELKQHGVALPDETARQLQDTEWPRAFAVWERRFARSPRTAAELAKQVRFLTARGFSPDIVRRIVRAGPAQVDAVDTGTSEIAGDTALFED